MVTTLKNKIGGKMKCVLFEGRKFYTKKKSRLLYKKSFIQKIKKKGLSGKNKREKKEKARLYSKSFFFLYKKSFAGPGALGNLGLRCVVCVMGDKCK